MEIFEISVIFLYTLFMLRVIKYLASKKCKRKVCVRQKCKIKLDPNDDQTFRIREDQKFQDDKLKIKRYIKKRSDQ